jgi:hypothetical protein
VLQVKEGPRQQSVVPILTVMGSLFCVKDRSSAYPKEASHARSRREASELRKRPLLEVFAFKVLESGRNCRAMRYICSS